MVYTLAITLTALAARFYYHIVYIKPLREQIAELVRIAEEPKLTN